MRRDGFTWLCIAVTVPSENEPWRWAKRALEELPFVTTSKYEEVSESFLPIPAL